MKKLVLTVLALIALFAALRAYSESSADSGMALHPGLVEIGDELGQLLLCFDLLLVLRRELAKLLGGRGDLELVQLRLKGGDAGLDLRLLVGEALELRLVVASGDEV